jgi:hypothetical protein
VNDLSNQHGSWPLANQVRSRGRSSHADVASRISVVMIHAKRTEPAERRLNGSAARGCDQALLAALQYAGYEARLEYGEGNHSGTHGASVLPETIRWMWRPRATEAAGYIATRGGAVI